MASIALDNVTANNMGVVKKLHQVAGVSHSGDFYEKLLTTAGRTAKLAFYGELPVGCLLFRIDNEAKPTGVYVDFLYVLDAYKDLGIGQKMLEFVESETTKAFQHDVFVKPVWFETGYETEGEWLRKRV